MDIDMRKTISTFLSYFLISFITSFSPKHFICAFNKFVHNSVVPSPVFGVHGKNPQTMDVDDHGIAETTASTAMDKSPLVKTTASTAMDKSPRVKTTVSTGF